MLAVPVAAAAALLLAGPASASTVDIVDEAHVLDATAVQNEAATLPVPITIWTTTQDAANKSTFDNDVRAKVTSAFPVVLGINTQAKHETLQIGRQAGLSQSAAISAEQSANSAFDSTMRSQNNYTAAVQAALTNLNGSLRARGGTRNGAAPSNSGSNSSVGTFIVFGVIVIVVILAVALIRRLFRPTRRVGPRVMGGPPMGGFNQGYGPPPGYGPGYGPGYRQGMSPGAAAGLGAVGGGLVGYELGKMAGENEQFRQDEMREGYGGYDNQNYGGGGDQGNWVVGQDSDFGGGGDTGGGFGGGDSGGGGGGDW
jgi:hypothetical protein